MIMIIVITIESLQKCTVLQDFRMNLKKQALNLYTKYTVSFIVN